MAIEKALEKATGTDKLPDLESTLQAAGEAKIRQLQAQAQIHALPRASNRHHTGKETQFWNKLIAFYDPEKATGGSGGSWWYPFD